MAKTHEQVLCNETFTTNENKAGDNYYYDSEHAASGAGRWQMDTQSDAEATTHHVNLFAKNMQMDHHLNPRILHSKAGS